MPTMRQKKTPSARIVAERLMWGDLFGASPPIRELAESARADVESGLTEEAIRQRIRSRMQSEGISTRAALFPTLTRKHMRVRLRALLHAFADLLATKAEGNRLGPALQPWLDKLGFDQWLEDYLWQYAVTGETSPIFDSFCGKAFVSEVGPEGDKTPTVWLIATPYSNVPALQEEFIELCLSAFPDATFSKRFDSMLEGARYLRMHEQHGISYGEIARRELLQARPDLAEGSEQFKELLRMNTETITQSAGRSFHRADRILENLSADSD